MTTISANQLSEIAIRNMPADSNSHGVNHTGSFLKLNKITIAGTISMESKTGYAITTINMAIPLFEEKSAMLVVTTIMYDRNTPAPMMLKATSLLLNLNFL